MSYPIVILKPKRDASIHRKHPWVFSGAIQKISLGEDQELQEGDAVWVANSKEQIIGTGHFSEASIAVRLQSFQQTELDLEFFQAKLNKAYELRKSLGFINNSSTNAYRLVHGEGDGLGGLVIDIYKDVAVIQAHSVGMLNALTEISSALQKVYNNELKAIYNKSEKSIHAQNVEFNNEYLFGDTSTPYLITENELSFQLDWINGQKTGFYLDQRENRRLLSQYAAGKKVLNTFCYSGGFSVYALNAGAKLVHSVDSSEEAIKLTEQNVKLLNSSKTNHQSFVADSLKYLNETDEKYDLIILDPPAYAKHPRVKHKAVQAYRRLNEKAMRKIESGGILFTFSCSQAIDRKLFEDTIRAAAIDAKREVKVLHHLSQPADHPVNVFHPEGEYLKGLALLIN